MKGTITLKKVLFFKGKKKLVNGNFTVDMTTINTTDLEGKRKSKLRRTIKIDDFFGVEKFPTATLVFQNYWKK